MSDELEDLLQKADKLRWITERGTGKWMEEFKNRIKGLVQRYGRDLRPHPKNPRRHPESQVSAVRGVLQELGIADALLIYVAADGVETIIDGECRGKNFEGTQWPCLLLEVSDEEAEYLLATFDPLAAQATTDAAALEELLGSLTVENSEVQALLEKVAREAGVVLNDTPPNVSFQEFDENAANEVKYHECPSCGHKWPK